MFSSAPKLFGWRRIFWNFFWPILKQTLSVADEQQVMHTHGENLRRREEMWTCLKSLSFIKKSACCSQRLPLAFFSFIVLLPPSSSPNFLCFYSFTSNTLIIIDNKKRFFSHWASRVWTTLSIKLHMNWRSSLKKESPQFCTMWFDDSKMKVLIFFSALLRSYTAWLHQWTAGQPPQGFRKNSLYCFLHNL